MTQSKRSTRVVKTDVWKLEVPDSVTAASPLICIPTVHPRGDQRIVRCAQVALNIGFRVKFVWLGAGVASDDTAAGEIIIPAAHSFWQRVTQLPRISALASRLSPDGWHIHDYYMLPFARRFGRKSGVPVIYDVHEYYATYYAEKLPLPAWGRRAMSRAIDSYQARTARRIGGANLVAAGMEPAFQRSLTPYSVTPNLPLGAGFRETSLKDFVHRSKRAIHTGSLNAPYGMYLLLDLAKECLSRELDVTFDLVEKFSSADDRAAFADYFRSIGSPSNIRLIPMVAAHKIPDLLGNYGIGLSMILRGGQNDVAIPTKLYEYALMGLYVVGTDRAAQTAAIERYTVGTVRDEIDVSGFADAIASIVDDPTRQSAGLQSSAVRARESLVWEAGPANELRKLYLKVFNERT